MFDVAAIQRALSARGYDIGPIDGIPGSRTGSAVRLFQIAQGLQVRDGPLTDELVAALKAFPDTLRLTVVGEACLRGVPVT